MNKQTDEFHKNNMIEYLRFFLPLGTTSILIGITHSLFNSALARLPSPEVYLSAFTVSKSLLQVIQNPIIMVRQMVTTLINDDDSYFKVRKFILILSLSVVSIFGLLAFTDGSRLIFKNILGVKNEVLNKSVIIFRVFVFIPLGIVLRNFMQGIAIKFRMTPLVSIATIARVIFVSIVLLTINYLNFIPPAILAGGMFLGAIFVEAITMFLGIKIPIRDIPYNFKKIYYDKHGETNKSLINNRIILNFFLPLVLTSFIKSLSRPIIDGGLARTYDPAIALSSYAVAWSLGNIIINIIRMFHQIPLNFIEDGNDSRASSVKKFGVYLSTTLSLIIGIMGFTPIGYIILTKLIGVTDEIATPAIGVLKIMTFLPYSMVLRQYYWGIFMKKHKTLQISIGKIVNLIALSLTIFITILISPKNPAIIGSIGMLSAESFEGLYLYVSNKKFL